MLLRTRKSETPSERHGSCPIGGAEDDADAGPEAAVARSLRDGAAALQPPLLESRLAYRIQELAYGGLKPETIKRLKAIAKDLDGGDPARRRRPVKDRPIAGTRLIREYQGVEHCVTVRDDDFEYQGRPYKSLSAVARAITGTQWNGLVFFGLKNQQGRA